MRHLPHSGAGVGAAQINLIDREGMRVLYEKQDTVGNELLPQAKDPETTAQWIERCLAGSEEAS